MLPVGAMILFLNGVPDCNADERSTPSNGNGLNVGAIRMQLPPLDLSQAHSQPEAIGAYRRFYRLDFENIRHYIGRFMSGEMAIAGQVFLPHRPVGTFFLMHGYFDHTGTLRNLIAACLEKGFAVAVFDLPGHGLSSGDRGAIDDFSQYASVLREFINAYAEDLPKPFHLTAHSTGCAGAYEYMNHATTIVFERIVFLAPLVRHAHWRISSIGYHLAKPFADTLPTMNRRNSSDEAFLEFTRNDPLRNSHLSIRFLDALHEWNRSIQHYKIISKPVLVIQGTDDGVVDWKYNVDFLQSKIIGMAVELVDAAKHQLINENQQLRQRVFDRLFEYVENR